MRTELENKMYITKKARFNAAQRIRLTQRCLSSTITLVSIIQILISLVLILNKNAEYQDLLTCFTIVASIFILVISNTSILNDGSKEAYIMHKCGLAIGKLYDELRFSESSNEGDISLKYDQTLIEYGINHNDIDKNLAVSAIKIDYNNTKELIKSALENGQKKWFVYTKYNLLHVAYCARYSFYYILNLIHVLLPDILFIAAIVFSYILINYFFTRGYSEMDLIKILSNL